MSNRKQQTPSSQLNRRRATALTKDSPEYTSRRQEIIDAAASIFGKEGYDGTSLADIAKAMGSDRATIYYYISSKEELLREICSSALDANLTATEEIAARDTSAIEKIRQVIAHHIAVNAHVPRWSVLVQETRRLAEADTDWASEEIARMRRYEGFLMHILEEGIADGSIREDVPPRLAMNAIFGMLNATSRWWNPEGQYDAQDLSTAFAAIAIEGLAGVDDRRAAAAT